MVRCTSTARIARAEDAVIPVYDHGFLYGEGVYETLRTYNRVPFLYDRHARGCARRPAYLALTVPFSDDELSSWIGDTMAAAGRDAKRPTSACSSRAASAS